jgi:hypothetical protein
MNYSQRARLADRDRGQRRVAQVTRGIAGGGGLAAAVITIVLAQGPASASTASTTTDSSPAQSAGSGSQSAPQHGQPAGDQALQPPALAPSPLRAGSSHARSGAS